MVLPSEPRDPGRPGPSGLTCGASLPARAGAPSTLRPVACRPASGARSGPLSEVWRCQVIAPGAHPAPVSAGDRRGTETVLPETVGALHRAQRGAPAATIPRSL